MKSTTSHLKLKLESVLACPLCNSGRESWDLNARTFGAGPYARDLFSIYRCRKCGMGITDPTLREVDSQRLYEDRTSTDFQGDDSSVAAKLKQMVATHDVQVFLQGAQLQRPANRALDYACGNGAFAVSMRRTVPNCDVWATDYHAEPPSTLKGSGVHYVTYEDLPSHISFDFILCRHVLEHTCKPLKFLQTMRDLMGPDGVLMIEVPNLQAPLRWVFGKYWDGYYVPYHPVHFTKAALRRAVIEAGLVPEKTDGCEMPKIGRSLQNLLKCRYNVVLFGAGILMQPLQLGAQLLTREPTCLRLWARKP